MNRRPAMLLPGPGMVSVARERRLAAATIILLLATLLIRLHTFARLEVGLDGALSIDLAMSPLAHMLAFNARDVHPPLFYAALKLWLFCAGAHYFTAKYLAILSSIAATALLIAIGKRLVGSSGGLLAAAIFVLAPTNVLLGPTVRDFTPGLAVSLLTVRLLLLVPADAAHRSTTWRTGVTAAISVATAVALLTWYFHVLFVALGLAIILGRQTYRLQLLAALIVGAALASPWYLYAVPRLLGKVERGTTAFGGHPTVPAPGALVGPAAHGLIGLDSPSPVALAMLLLWLVLTVAGVWALAQHRRMSAPPNMAMLVASGSGAAAAQTVLGSPEHESARAWAILALGCSLAALAIVALAVRWNAPADTARYVIVLVPFAALLHAAAATRGRRAIRVIGIVGVLGLLALNEGAFVRLVQSTPIDWAHDPAVAIVRAHMRPGDAVLFSDRARRLRFRLTPHPGVQALAIHTAGQRYLQSDLTAVTARVVDAALPHVRRLWYVDAGDPPGTPATVFDALASRAYLARRQTIAGTDLSLYGVGRPDRTVTPRARFGTLAELTAASYSTIGTPGSVVLVKLHWLARRPSSIPYTVFVHLDDASGKTIAQHDGEPMAGLRPTTAWRAGAIVDDRHGVALPTTLAPGAYRLLVGLYHGDQRLTLPNGTNQLLLGTVTVR